MGGGPAGSPSRAVPGLAATPDGENPPVSASVSGSRYGALADPDVRLRRARERVDAEREARARAWSIAVKQGWEPKGEEDGRAYELAAVRGDHVYVRTSFNRDAAISTAVTPVRQTAPYSLDGQGVVVGIWDEGTVRGTHQELAGGRVVNRDGGAIRSHSTHVGGTIGATGKVDMAKGMAPAVRIDSFDWDYDYAEMVQNGMASPAETNMIPLSNHSYGYQAGWHNGRWYGTWGDPEAAGFGLYDYFSVETDAICYEAPYLLPFKSAGNDRNDRSPSPGSSFLYFEDNTWKSKAYDPDTDPPGDGYDGGYDTVAYDGNAKNIMSVGAVNDAVAGGRRLLSAATMMEFSGWGPCDDGRIKPDIVANGASLFSCFAGSDTSYGDLSGTSMSSPNAAGSAALLVQCYADLFPGHVMLASTLKGLIIHTADDLGNPGPDYQFGWGLMNTHAAADHIRAHHAHTNAHRIEEGVFFAESRTNRLDILWDRTSPIRVTLCWTDPPGEERTALDDPFTNLVHDLDLRIEDPLGGVHYPFVLSRDEPANPATTGDNNVDNVEQVFIAAPAAPGIYRIVVSVQGPLSAPLQPYSLLVGGAGVNPIFEHVPLGNTTNTLSPYRIEARIVSEKLVRPESVMILWTRNGSPHGAYTNAMHSVSPNVYEGEIPAQPAGTEISYAIVGTTVFGLSGSSPENAPTELHRFSVVEPAALMITGAPRKVPGVTPAYGVHIHPSGIIIEAKADKYSPPRDGERDICVGWAGFGSVPSSGTGNQLSFALEEDSLLAWQWKYAYALFQNSSVPGIVNTTSWWTVSQTGVTVDADMEIVFGGTNLALAGWKIDSARHPAPNGPSENPVRGILMDTSHVATAVYLPAAQDGDGDMLPDWWEQFYFGAEDAVGNIDVDDDGFSNSKEYGDRTNPRDGASFPVPPSIAHAPLQSPVRTPAPWTIAAVVSDNQSISDVSLEWSRNGGAWQSAAMSLNPSEGYYEQPIPAPGVGGDRFSYRIVARDSAGLTAVNGPYSFDVLYPLAEVSADQTGLIELPSSRSETVLVTVSNVGTAPLTWRLAVEGSGFVDDAESGTNGWSHSGRNDAWHLSSGRAYSGMYSWYFGNDVSKAYPDNADASLVTPSVLLGDGAQLTFQHWLFTETLKDEEHAWDGCMVEISTNGGQSFAQIAPAGGYPYVMYGHSASAFPDGTPCFAGTGGWQKVVFDLGAFADQEVLVRFRFGSDGYVVDEGWYLDDIRITPHTGAEAWLAVSPTSGVVLPAATSILEATVSTDAIAPSETRWAVLRIESDDPFTPVVRLPLGVHNLHRLLVATATAGGSISPSGSLLLLRGDSTNFVMQAAPYYHLARILTNGAAATPPLSITQTNFLWRDIDFYGIGSVEAIFDANRASNGVAEAWLVAYGLTNDGFDAEVFLDRDGDGLAAWEEYVAGTDPTNAASVFEISTLLACGTNYLEHVFIGTNDVGDAQVFTQQICQADSIVVRWPSVEGRRYDLHRSVDPQAAYIPALENIEATPPENVYTDQSFRVRTRAYRVHVSYPDE